MWAAPGFLILDDKENASCWLTLRYVEDGRDNIEALEFHRQALGGVSFGDDANAWVILP